MPQDSMFTDQPRLTGVTIEVKEEVAGAGSRWHVSVRLQHVTGHPRTVYAGTWEGVMLDILPTLGSDVLSSFLFDYEGEVKRSCFSVASLARKHRRRYERVG